MGVHWNAQTDWVTGEKVKSGFEKVVLTTNAVSTAGPDEEEVDYEKEPSDEEDGDGESLPEDD
jgi:hypothetical protein